MQTGQIATAKTYYLSLFQGVTGLIQSGDVLVEIASKPATDAAEKINYKKGKTIGTVAKTISEEALKGILYKYNLYDPAEFSDVFFAAVGGVKAGFQEKISSGVDSVTGLYTSVDDVNKLFDKNVPLEFNLGGKQGGVIVGTVAAVGALVTVGVLTAVGKIDSERAVNIVSSAVTAGLAAYAIYEVYDKVQKATKALENAGKTLGLANKMKEVSSQVTQASKIAGVIGLIVTVVAQVGIFLYQFLSGAFAFGSDAFYNALVGLVVAVVFAVLMFAIAQIPIVGPIIVAIFGLIEGLIQLFCAILDKKGGICDGIIGNLTKILTVGFVGTTTNVVDLQNKDRLKIDNLQLNPDPNEGFAVGSSLNMSLSITNTLYPAFGYFGWAKGWRTKGIDHPAFDWDVVRSNFRYEIQAGIDWKHDIHENLEKNEDLEDFPYSYYWTRGPLGLYYRNYQVSGLVPLDYAGVNQTVRPVWLAEGSAVHTRRCGLFSGCKSGTDRRTVHINISSNVKYDIFPRTLDGA